jgi:hypothetical protein
MRHRHFLVAALVSGMALAVTHLACTGQALGALAAPDVPVRRR